VVPRPRVLAGTDASSVSLDDALADGKARPAPARDVRLACQKPVEDVRKIVFRDATARVLDGNLHSAVRVRRAGPQPSFPASENFRAFPRRFESYLQQPVAVRVHRLHVVRYLFPPSRQRAWRGPVATKLDGLMEQRARVDALLADREGAGLDPRHVEQVGNQTLHAADGAHR